MNVSEKVIEVQSKGETFKFTEQYVDGLLRKVIFYHDNRYLFMKLYGLADGKNGEHSPAHLHLFYKRYSIRVNLEKLGFLCLEGEQLPKQWHCTDDELKQIQRFKKEKVYPPVMSYLAERHKVLLENFKKINQYLEEK